MPMSSDEIGGFSITNETTPPLLLGGADDAQAGDLRRAVRSHAPAAIVSCGCESSKPID